MDKLRETRTPHGLIGWQYGTGPIFVGQFGKLNAQMWCDCQKKLDVLRVRAKNCAIKELENASIER